ncbi:hypothetical protein [Enterocloster clostridioformis]|nr:hypothetical protein [Enterocloster clostridioformis]
MFLKTGELKKIMKASLKKHGLIVGNVDDHCLVYSDCWGVYVEHQYASNKFKAAIMELIGDLPEPGECYHYTIGADKELVQEAAIDYPDPFEDWKRAKDFAAITPMFLTAWPHEYLVFQRHSDLSFLTAKRKLSCDVISASELDHMAEGMPRRPSMLCSVLYFKNETTIYWVHTESPETKAREVLFPHMRGISFFEDDWIDQEEEELTDLKEEAAEEQLPY